LTKGERDIFNSWWKMQDNLLNTWKEAFSSFPTGSENNFSFLEIPFQAWQNLYKMQELTFKVWKESLHGFQLEPEKTTTMFNPGKIAEMFRPDTFAEVYKTGRLYSQETLARLQREWLKMFSRGLESFTNLIPSRVGQEAFQKMKGASEVYLTLLRFWKEFIPRLPLSNDINKWKEFSQEWLGGYADVLESFYAAWLPESLRSIIKSPKEIARLVRQNYFDFLAPWFDAANMMQTNMFTALEGDRESCLDFIRAWQDGYQQSFGKLFKVPTMGLTRENMEKFNESIDAYMQYLTTINKFSAVMYSAGFEAMEKLLKKYAHMLEDGQAPISFYEFYRLWWQTNDETLMEVFKTESFSELLGKVVNAGARYKKCYDNLMTEVLTNSLPIPTNKEMDNIYKIIQELKRLNREQNRKLEKMQNQLNQLLTRLEKLEKDTVEGRALA
jgi:hypothetical protein